MTATPSSPALHPLSRTGRYLVLAAAFLGWLFSGVQMSLMNLASRSATEDFILSGQIDLIRDPDTGERPALSDAAAVKRTLSREAPRWFSYYNSAFLFGAALGGLTFGWLGDRGGRVRAMGFSILWYAVFAGAGYFASSPGQLLWLRFASAMGVGGMWPTGVALAAEAWDDVSRPLLSGLIGTAANVGIVLMGIVGYFVPITVTSWRWIMLVAACPVLLGGLVLILVPESPAWLAAREKQRTSGLAPRILRDLLRPPLLGLTLLGIALGAIPLLGGWGVTAWLIPWSDQVLGGVDPKAKALTSIMRAGGGSLGSLIGGWVASLCGRRLTYFLISLFTVLTSEFIYFNLRPDDAWFSTMVFVVGFISTVFFGWLPLYLPEMFPTHARASGAGISFNFGRILTALGVLGTGALTAWFGEDYAAAGRVTSLIYALGMLVILFAPDTSGRNLKEA